MASKKGMGLFLVWTDIPEEVEEEFNRWYNEEHIAEILAMPGFLDAARYVAVRGGPKYLACYELEGPDARETPEFLWHWDHPSEWSKRVSPRHAGINYFGNVYQQIYPAEVSQSDMSSFLLIGRMEVLPEIEDEFNQWYDTIQVPDFEKVPGCVRGRRYRAVRGGPKYATVYDMEHGEVMQSPEWVAAREANPQSQRIQPQIRHSPGSPGVYKKIFQP